MVLLVAQGGMSRSNAAVEGLSLTVTRISNTNHLWHDDHVMFSLAVSLFNHL